MFLRQCEIPRRPDLIGTPRNDTPNEFFRSLSSHKLRTQSGWICSFIRYDYSYIIVYKQLMLLTLNGHMPIQYLAGRADVEL